MPPSWRPPVPSGLAVRRGCLRLRGSPACLVLDHPRGVTGDTGEAQQEAELELEGDLVADAQRIDDHPVGELDEVEAAERRRVLVLHAARDAEILALDGTRQLRDLVLRPCSRP